MNWAYKEVGLGWIGLIENVSRKWVSTLTLQAHMALTACEWVVDVSHCLQMLQVWELVHPNASFFVENVWIDEARL